MILSVFIQYEPKTESIINIGLDGGLREFLKADGSSEMVQNFDLTSLASTFAVRLGYSDDLDNFYLENKFNDSGDELFVSNSYDTFKIICSNSQQRKFITFYPLEEK